MNAQVQREVVKIGLDFRPILIDVGDDTVWEFTSDPSPEQWSALVNALRKFTTLQDENAVGGTEFEDALHGFTKAMSMTLIDPEQQEQWIERRYGLGPQQAVSEHLMEQWSGFPTKELSPSGQGSKPTG